MKKLLYVNGCSHCCGAEISYVGSHRESKDLELSWPGKLAKSYNLIHKNDALSGQGNQSIFSNTVHSILNLLKTHKPEEIFVIIGWSGFERTDYIYEDKRYMFIPGFQEVKQFSMWPSVIKKAFNSWILGCDFDNHLMNQNLLYYFSMKNFLEKYNVEYYFINTVHSYVVPVKNLMHDLDNFKVTTDLVDMLKNDVRYLEPFNNDMAYYQYMKVRYNGHIDGRNHHFLEDAQQEWAELIDEKIGHLLV